MSTLLMVGLVLVLLKLLGYTSIGWWWVTLPFWIVPVALLALFLMAALLILVRCLP